MSAILAGISGLFCLAVLGLVAMLFRRPETRKALDRLSFRLLVYALIAEYVLLSLFFFPLFFLFGPCRSSAGEIRRACMDGPSSLLEGAAYALCANSGTSCTIPKSMDSTFLGDSLPLCSCALQ
jgi:hypothetical protein